MNRTLKLTAYPALALLVSLNYIFHSQTHFDPWGMYAAVLDGTAERPYVYRRLTPELATLLDMGGNWPWLTGILNLPADQTGVAISTLLLMSLSLWGFMLILPYLDENPETISPWFIMGVAISPLMVGLYGHVYDFPTLFLSTAFLLLVKRYPAAAWATVIVFILATLNRETSVVLLLPLAVWMYQTRQTDHLSNMVRHLSYLALLGVLYLAIQLYIRYGLYPDAPGQLSTYFLYMINRYFPAYPERLPAMLLFFGATLLALFWRWSQQQRFLKTALLPLFPLLLSYIFLGMAFEWRVFFEVWGIIALMLYRAYPRMLGIAFAVSMLITAILKPFYPFELLQIWSPVFFTIFPLGLLCGIAAPHLYRRRPRKF